jgi:NitT/TauT family transport system substrate-binding protein
MSTTRCRTVRRAALGTCAVLLLALRPALADDPLSVILGDKTPPLMNSLNLIAQGAGFYRDEHLNVTTILVDGTDKVMDACTSGTADICPIGIEAAITAYGQGKQLKMFLTRASKFGYVLTALEDSPIKSLADFRGKTIGVHTLTGASPVLTTQSALATVGLKPTDYTLVAIGMSDSAATAISSGKVQAAALPLYELIPYLVGGMKLRIWHHPTLGSAANAGYLSAPSVLAAKHAAIGRFSRAIVKASVLIHYHPDIAARAMLSAVGKPFTSEDVQRRTAELNAWQQDLPAANPDSRQIGAPSLPVMQRYLQLLKDAGAVKTLIPVADVATDEFVAFANDFDRKAIRNISR